MKYSQYFHDFAAIIITKPILADAQSELGRIAALQPPEVAFLGFEEARGGAEYSKQCRGR